MFDTSEIHLHLLDEGTQICDRNGNRPHDFHTGADPYEDINRCRRDASKHDEWVIPPDLDEQLVIH